MSGKSAWKKFGLRLRAAGLAFGLTSAVGAGSAAAGTVLASANGPGGHRYEVVADNSISWSGAKAAAEQAGGFLATVGDQQEQSFIEGLLADSGAPSGSYVFGLDETATEGDYRPLSGVPLGFNHFLAGQPDDNTATVAAGE